MREELTDSEEVTGNGKPQRVHVSVLLEPWQQKALARLARASQRSLSGYLRHFLAEAFADEEEAP